MRKLFKLAPLNARENIFILPDGICEAIFDRDTMLEEDRYLIDPMDRSVKLKMRPFGKVRALVKLGGAVPFAGPVHSEEMIVDKASAARRAMVAAIGRSPQLQASDGCSENEEVHPDSLAQLIAKAVEVGADRAIRRAMMTRDRGKP